MIIYQSTFLNAILIFRGAQMNMPAGNKRTMLKNQPRCLKTPVKQVIATIGTNICNIRHPTL